MRCTGVTVLGLGMVVGLCGAPAIAGPWARPAGDVFLSFQISAEEAPSDVMAGLWEPETYLSAYAEVGLGHSLTLGVDLGQGELSRQVVGFVRYSLSAPDATWQFAVDAGLGVRQLGEADAHGLVRLGASLGRGFGGGGDAWYMPMRHQGGWVTLDLVALYDLEVDETILQAEGTLGFSLTDRASLVFSMKAEDWPDSDPLLTASPSFVFQIREGTSLRLGARGALTGSDAVGISLSLWQEF
ncbi:hypothetical protein KUL25_11525 [Rhodobacteraceae bacterium N5(2021)]|uniref:Uncharacterized protein n=1 Tax=Gymnodinialimonas phycosphaerae TaxID=2841589 RepID=A0A975YEA9_9RHOB|nr:hypothetical protein [Gymnodinialimonas phycosphaerae]MBY4893394.1 hypothetical protein [Gymnodinialimonas phycosphaerae]